MNHHSATNEKAQVGPRGPGSRLSLLRTGAPGSATNARPSVLSGWTGDTARGAGVLGVWGGANAHAQSTQFDPAGSNVLLTAVTWLQGTLLGNVATTIAIIAIGVTGMMMLTGRIDWRRGATVILGCFVVFGAAAIVSGIRSVSSGVG